MKCIDSDLFCAIIWNVPQSREGGIGVFGFTALVIFEIGFSVFTLKMSGFLGFLSVVVFDFYLFKHPVFGFYQNEKRFIWYWSSFAS